MTVKIKKIELTGFRGALSPVSLNFPDNGNSSIILYGEGGTGKTTFTEALEWFYKDKVDSLEKEFCGKECYFNLKLDGAKNATVAIEFDQPAINDVKTLTRGGANSHSNKTSNFNDYLTASSRENFILRYNDLKEFVDDRTKAQKLDHFAKLVGFEKITSVRTILNQAFNALKNSSDLSQMEGRLKEAKKFLTEKLGSEIVAEDAVLTYAREQLKSANCDMRLESLSGIPEIVKKLYELADTSLIGKRKHALESFKDSLIIPKDHCAPLLEDISSWIADYNEYLLDAEAIQRESLLKLYSIGKQILGSKEWSDKDMCPLCESKIDGGKLIEHLSFEVGKIEGSLGKKKTVDTSLKTLNSKFTGIIDKLKTDKDTIAVNKLNEKVVADSRSDLIAHLEKAIDAFQELLSELNGKHKALQGISCDLDKTKGIIDELSKAYDTFKELIQKEINSLVVGPEIQKNMDTAKLLETLAEQFKRTKELDSKVEQFNRQGDSLGAILEAFEKQEKEAFQQIISILSSDIDTYYSLLNPGEGVEEITLFPTENKGAERGLEISYKFHGTEQYPAKKYLSESHRNSLGISIFLASARYFNKVNQFLILDDIYTSLDVNHRERLITLFTHPSLSDKQFLITTHDLVWFKTMQRTLQPNSKWKFMEIRKWRIDTGIEIAEAPESIRKRIIDFLDKGETFAACKSIRSYYEETLKRIGKKLEVRVPYRESANWEAGEFYSGIGERVSGSSIASDTRFSSGNPIGFLANLITHENDASVTTGTVRSLIGMIDNFDKAFCCDSCGKDVWYARRGNGGFQCQCGTMHCG